MGSDAVAGHLILGFLHVVLPRFIGIRVYPKALRAHLFEAKDYILYEAVRSF